MGCAITSNKKLKKNKKQKKNKEKEKQEDGNKQKQMEGEIDEAVNEKHMQLHMFEDSFVASTGFGRIVNKIWIFVCGPVNYYHGICIGWVRLGHRMWGSGGVIGLVAL